VVSGQWLFAVDNYGSFGDDNTSDEDDDSSDDDVNDNYYYESGATSLVTFPDSDVYYPDFGVPNIGLQLEISSPNIPQKY